MTTLLVIEDNATNLALMTYMLQSFGYDTLSAADGAEGLEVARRERPALILCDIQMPRMDGYAFARARAEDAALRDIPLVAVTAYAMVGDRDRMLQAGFDAYIAKPIEPMELIALVRARLPAAEAQGPAAAREPTAAVPAQAPEAGKPGPDRRRPILALDDAPLNLQLERDLLEPHGYTVLTADSMAEALALARQHLPVLIISDMGMKAGSGFDFIRQVKADPLLKDIPFIFLSATHWDEDSRRQGLALGAVRYLCRPIEPVVLLAEIRGCLAAPAA